VNQGVFGIIAPHPPIMVPEVGGARAEVTAQSAASMDMAAELLSRYNPDTVVLMSPHAPAASDAFIVETASEVEGDLGQFGASEVHLAYRGDPELAFELIEGLEKRGIPVVDRADAPSLHSGHLDHAVLVPMSFLDPDGRWPLLVLSLSWLPYSAHREYGQELAAAAERLGRKIAFIASGDCSHRLTRDAPAGYDALGAEFDRTLVQLIGESDFEGLSGIDPELIERAGECGLRSFIAMGGVAAGGSARILSYEGPWGVGYLTALVNERLAEEDPDLASTPQAGSKGGAAGEVESEIVSLARRAITVFLETGQRIESPTLSDAALPQRAGAFVSLHMNDQLRGCIGTIVPTTPSLAEEVVRNAIEAATADPRFPSMSREELDDLEISVDVLHAPEGCEFEDLDPAVFGVIVSCGWKRGLLLPDLEGVDLPEQQVDIACRKAGIGPTERVELQRFKVDRHV